MNVKELRSVLLVGWGSVPIVLSDDIVGRFVHVTRVTWGEIDDQAVLIVHAGEDF